MVLTTECKTHKQTLLHSLLVLSFCTKDEGSPSVKAGFAECSGERPALIMRLVSTTALKLLLNFLCTLLLWFLCQGINLFPLRHFCLKNKQDKNVVLADSHASINEGATAIFPPSSIVWFSRAQFYYHQKVYNSAQSKCPTFHN